jgi:polyadenylate-binding protein 2
MEISLESSYAYIEFADAEAVEKAIKLNNSLFRGRQISVEKKRKNTPGLRRRRYGYFPMGRAPRMFPPYSRRSRYMFY